MTDSVSPHTRVTLAHCKASLVCRPHPLMTKSSLVNQVKFLGLAYTLATTIFDKYCVKPGQKRYECPSGAKNFTAVREVLCNK